MQFDELYITYLNQSTQDEFVLRFKLRDHPVTERWINKVLIAKKKYAIDDPARFSGFGTVEKQKNSAIQKINDTIDTINSFQPIVDRYLKDIDDQDTLNYLHHIFEVYHGLLDQQTNVFWNSSPTTVRKALSDLNLLVHRCETVSREVGPYHIVTWFRLPKVDLLRDDEYSLFEYNIKKGTVYLLYTEIGKNLEELFLDNDQYIFDTAFQPFKHYSADFIVKFWNQDLSQSELKRAGIKRYYQEHEEFFISKGLPWGHPHLSLGLIPLADITDAPDNYLEILTDHQYVKDVNFI